MPTINKTDLILSILSCHCTKLETKIFAS
jgi:hypothetical protein